MVLSVIIMLAGMALMIYTVKKQQKLQNAQTLAIVGLAVVVLGAIMLLTKSCGSDTDAIISKQGKLQNAKMTVIGNYVAEKFKGKKIAILTDKAYPQNEIMADSIDAFKKAVGGDVKVYTIQLMPDQPGEGETLQPGGSAEDFMTGKNIKSGLLEAAADKPDVIVMMYISMPVPSEFIKIGFNSVLGSKEDTSKPILVIATEPTLYDPISYFIETGKIAAVIATKTDSKFNIIEDSIPSDAQEAFDLRCILIDAENLPTYQKYFQTPEEWNSMLPENLHGYME